jgi:hypothetical protein
VREDKGNTSRQNHLGNSPAAGRLGLEQSRQWNTKSTQGNAVAGKDGTLQKHADTTTNYKAFRNNSTHRQFMFELPSVTPRGRSQPGFLSWARHVVHCNVCTRWRSGGRWTSPPFAATSAVLKSAFNLGAGLRCGAAQCTAPHMAVTARRGLRRSTPTGRGGRQG